MQIIKINEISASQVGKKKQKPVGLGGYRARHFYFLKKLGCR
jgi:hypothetical protein